MAKRPSRLELDVGLDEAHDELALRGALARHLQCSLEATAGARVVRRAIDARRGRVRFHVDVVFEPPPPLASLGLPEPREVSGSEHVVVVGAGPAGLFAAYELARAGVRSTVLDRGKQVQPRRRDLALLNRGERIDPESNYCFGEGGAGTYSDGKLYTRADKRGGVRDVLEVLVRHGATSEILVDARPHIGSNKLPKVVTALRDHLLACGVELRFGARVDALRVRSGRAVGVTLADGTILEADAVVVATGHSARDVYGWLYDAGVRLDAKPFALGVRIEHPQELVDRTQYGKDCGHPRLPAAYYRVAETIEARGVFSFCMCPGGWIVPASTEVDGLVVNGMSLSRRDSPFANSGLVVAVEPGDWERAGYRGPLGGIELQRAVERAALVAGGTELKAPATRGSDFVRGRGSSTVPGGSYLPGFTATDVGTVLDAGMPGLTSRLRDALKVFERRMPGYAGDAAVLVATESRTSSPVRVPRDRASFESPDVERLYPVGEGAGYAGGIVSAALDGQNAARAVLAALGRTRG